MPGLLFSFCRTQGITGAARFTFNTTYLYSGLDLFGDHAGLFAVPVVVTTIVSGKPIIFLKLGKKWIIQMCSRRSWCFQALGVWLRSAIEATSRVIPASVVRWPLGRSYGQAKYTSKTSEKYGTGCIEGVIGRRLPKTPRKVGTLLTTFGFGIPGGGIMAFFLAAFHDCRHSNRDPKCCLKIPPFVSHAADRSHANVLGCLLCLAFAKYVFENRCVGRRYICSPESLPILCVGCYASNSLMLDLVVNGLRFGIMGVVHG